MLDAMVEGARVSVPIPDTGSLLADFATYATKLVEVVTAPTVEATLHAVAATGDGTQRSPTQAGASGTPTSSSPAKSSSGQSPAARFLRRQLQAP